MSKKPIELVDGINECENSDYHADRKYLSSSVLKTVHKSLDQYYHEYILGQKKEISKETQAIFDYGTLCHSYILEPEKVESDFSFFEGFRKAGSEFEEFKARVGTKKPIISASQNIQALDLIKAYQAHPVASSFIKGGFAEHTICGELHGIPIKIRTDYLNADEGYIVDVKTTAYPAEKESFKLTVEGLMYHLSAALYCAMAEKYYGKPFKFYFLVLSKKTKECEVYRLSEAKRQEGDQIVAAACAKYWKAKVSGNWSELKVSADEKERTDYTIEEI